MVPLTYGATWSKEVFSNEFNVPKKRSASPRGRSRSVHSPRRAPRMRFASGQQFPLRMRADEWSSEWSSEYEFEREDSLWISTPSLDHRRRSPERSPERGAPLRPRGETKEMNWLQVIIYSVVMFSAIGLLIKMIFTLQGDLQLKYADAREEVVAEIAGCHASYELNYCRDNPPPALAHVCRELVKCMERNSDGADQLNVTAEALGEIIEAFVNALDPRSMVALACMFGTVLYVC